MKTSLGKEEEPPGEDGENRRLLTLLYTGVWR